jgi:acyl-CoA reductase-like NAD-dependent aldehyde dehydrogenase
MRDVRISILRSRHAPTGSKTWQAISAFDRYKLMRRAADLVRERKDMIANWMTIEQRRCSSRFRRRCRQRM